MSKSAECRLCPRNCRARRNFGERGRCGELSAIRIARAAPHFWEEPIISGKNGTGAIFFSGCALRCIYCQNYELSRGRVGREISCEELLRIVENLQRQGVHSISLITPSHFTRSLIPVLETLRRENFPLPIIWNSGGYEKVSALKMLDGLVDVYLPDFKYFSSETARAYSDAPDYPEVAKAALAEMVRQRGTQRFSPNGLLTRGVQVRHLLLPGHAQECRQVLWYLHNHYRGKIGVSILNQYTPMPSVASDPLLSRHTSVKSYEQVLRYALRIGMDYAYIQEPGADSEAFIPDFESGVGIQ